MWPISFTLPDLVPPAASAALLQARFAGGYDQTPVPTKIEVRDGRLIASRALQESGYLLVPWPIEGLGVVLTSTATIRERAEPYNLLVELARGKLNQVRCQSSDWCEMGLQLPRDFPAQLSSLARLFGSAVLSQDSPDGSAIAERVLQQSHTLAARLVQVYIEQLFATRLHESGKLTTRFAARSPVAAQPAHAAEVRSAFNAAAVAFRWKDIEPQESQYDWAATDQAVSGALAAKVPITGGPVIDLTPGMLPDWTRKWTRGDVSTPTAFMSDFLETIVKRYKGHIRRWVVVAGANQADTLGLSDDDRFRLVARLFEAATQADPKLELVLSIAQPWGDYLTNEDETISPLAFADDLSRHGVKISAVELELRSGVMPRGSLPRDLLETSRVLDLFSVLQLPLEVVFSCPSSDAPDSNAIGGQAVWSHGWPAGLTPDVQAAWGAAFTALALCKPHVRSVTWDHWSDAAAHLTPNGGLIDAAGTPKPLLARLRSLRTTYLA
jgi:hypothetical protein